MVCFGISLEMVAIGVMAALSTMTERTVEQAIFVIV